MALPGLLIEYLVVGAMALLWALPLLSIDRGVELSSPLIGFLAPVLYVLGMFIDFVAYILLTRLPTKKYSIKSLVRRISSCRYPIEFLESNPFSYKSRLQSAPIVQLSGKSPELLKEINERSSRDRIARGSFINILLLWITCQLEPNALLINLNQWQWFGLALFSLTVWAFLERHSYLFELAVGEEILIKPAKEAI